MYSAFMDYGEVLVIGGTGFLGRHVARALVARGFLPRLLARVGSEGRIPEDVRNACRVTPGDATDPESVENAVQGTSAIVNLAGIVREYPRKRVTFERVHVAATRNAVVAARRWEVSRLVQVSALGARPGGRSRFFDSKWRGEEIVRKSGLRWTIVRPSAIFGTGDRFIDTLMRVSRRSPVVAVPGDGRVRFQPVYAGDVAHAIADAVCRPAAEGRSIDLGGPESLSLNEVLDAVGGAVGRRIAKVHLPLSLVRPLVRSLSRLEKFPFSAEEIDFLAEDNVCESGGHWSDIGRKPLSLGEYLAGMTTVPSAGPVAGPGGGTLRKEHGGAAGTQGGIGLPSRKAA